MMKLLQGEVASQGCKKSLLFKRNTSARPKQLFPKRRKKFLSRNRIPPAGREGSLREEALAGYLKITSI